MKRLLAILTLALGLPVLAQAETTFDGTVVAGKSVSITAPFGGTVASFSLRAGSLLALGDTIAAIETTKVYAAEDGTVTGLFAQEGDSVESVVSRYGAVLYLAPTRKYTISADIEKAYNSSATKYVNIGETLYISCTSDGAHTATGTVVAASGTGYTVETLQGELLMEETVNLYRSADLSAVSRVGRGKVGRSAEIAVTGSGSVLRLHVADGDTVARGDLLFETVAGTLDGLYATGNQILADASGVVASVHTSAGAAVSKGDTLLTLYPTQALQIEIAVDEYDLPAIAQGDTVSLSFNYDEDHSADTTGVVEMISHLSTGENGEASYPAYISFTPDENVRIGMTVTVSTLDSET